MERKKQIEVEEKEVARKDKELVATIKRPAEAESYKVETIAQGRRYAHFTNSCGLCSSHRFADLELTNQCLIADLQI